MPKNSLAIDLMGVENKRWKLQWLKYISGWSSEWKMLPIFGVDMVLIRVSIALESVLVGYLLLLWSSKFLQALWIFLSKNK